MWVTRLTPHSLGEQRRALFNNDLNSTTQNSYYLTMGVEPDFPVDDVVKTHFPQGGFEAVVFMSPVLSDVLQSTSRIHVDATFKVLPRQLQAKQLLTIHRIQNNKLFTCAYVIMTRKPIAGYSLVFEFVRNVLRGLNPSIIMTDYEESLRRSLRTAFPNATLIGCWFHFDQTTQEGVHCIRVKNTQCPKRSNSWETLVQEFLETSKHSTKPGSCWLGLSQREPEQTIAT
uniref:MULE transposase domain-containing protein n=1 Tax=Timema monikensis TaxID=170555 RepID=A0A7R9E5V9_9NEOP|nr:unnamed protein product [Timema monikensis]